MTTAAFPNTLDCGCGAAYRYPIGYGGFLVSTLSDDERADITAVILAGGEGRRMGGEDKGLVHLAGCSMVEHVLARIAPQVGRVIINANRNRSSYARLGHPVFSDELNDFQGPLAGVATALAQIDTPLLLTLPCDSPTPPADLAQRLYRALQERQADAAVAHDGQRMHPVFALLRRELLASLSDYLLAGDRKMELWLARNRYITVDFSDEADAFANVNSPEDHAEQEKRLLAPAPHSQPR
jgi:molybdenum cofactor guanylyltransferase